ncbi:ATP-grasp domain-containing protein [Aureispira anguillae]|uniref:ATP-grasp domain-containing protein n=1 Tax=Aureispira anguillae TaxID=2864201 RepID=A0A916DVU2_9BACT|nr:hypothetical protein [Aureispira anguillae]BDS13436.1 hypothetical protein AsAng_0041730 [Aureispira anguillae]
MLEKIKVGLWIPPRKDINKTIDVDNPAGIDVKIHESLMKYLDDSGVEYFEDLDFRNAIIKNDQVYLGSFCMSDLDYFVWMGDIDRSLDSYHLEVLRVLEMNVEVHNSFTFYREATDKFSAFSILHNHGVPVSELYLVNIDNVTAMEHLFDNNSFLLKPRRSSWGLGIVKIDAFEQLRDIIEYHPKQYYYLEKFYPNDLADWTGVTVINGTILYGFRKKSSKISGWKVYDRNKTGGEVDYVEVNKEIEAITLKIGEVLNANFYGLDLIKTAEGYKVVDINCHPGIYHDLIEELNLPIAELFFKGVPLLEPSLV